jgi:hypothetical protein
MAGRGKPGKPKPGFPRFPPPLEIAPRFPHFHNPDDDSSLPKNQNPKKPKGASAPHSPIPPSSGSSFDEKMLGLVPCVNAE